MILFKRKIMLFAVGLVFFLFLLPGMGMRSEWKVIHSDESSLELVYYPVFEGYDTVICQDGTETLLPVINDAKPVGKIHSSPLVLQSAGLITVPSENGFRLSSLSIKCLKPIGAYMAPVREYDNSTALIDKAKYDSYKMPEWLNIQYTGLARTRHIARINAIAAMYNPATHSIEIADSIFIRITFDKVPENSPIISDTYDPAITLNHNQTLGWRTMPVKDSRDGKSDKILAAGSGIWLKIAVTEEGIYKIDRNMLSSMGAYISEEDVPTIKIFGNGGQPLSEKITEITNNTMNEQPIIVRTTSDGNLDYILFYAATTKGFKYENGKIEHFLNPYSTKNYYLFTFGGEAGKRAVPEIPPSGEAANYPVNYTARIFYNEEFTNAFYSGSGRIWFGGQIFPRVFQPLLLPNLDRNGSLLYRICVAHRTNSDTDGIFTFYENNEKIGNILMGATPASNYIDANMKMFETSIPASQISGDNRSVLKIEYVNKLNPSATPFFNWYEIHYPRNFIPIDNEISFFSEAGTNGISEFNINGFNGSEILGFDVSSPSQPVLLQNSAVTGGMYIFRKDLTGLQPHKYYISSKIKSPVLEKADFAGLRTNFANKNLIILTHPDFLSSAQDYAAYRESRGELTTTVITTEQIFNEFAGGMPDPTAIRDYIGFCFDNWQVKPQYILLWGDGHYDYRNIISSKKDFIPPYESFEAPVLGSTDIDAKISFTSDDYFVRVAGNDDLIDLAIGRIPIDQTSKGNLMVEKIKDYEMNSSLSNWRSNVTLLADDSFKGYGSSGDRSQHVDQSESLSSNFIPKDMIQKKLYLVEYPTVTAIGGRRKPRLNEDFISTVNTSGNLIVNWVGHGNPRVLAHEEIFERSLTVPLLTNYDKLFFLSAATCDFLRFDMPDTRCGAEELILSETGGSIGVIAATRVVYAGENAFFNRKLFQELFSRELLTGKYLRLGDALYYVKQTEYELNDDKYNLLGDPSMRILMPDLIISIDTINDKFADESGEPIVLQGLSEVKISGSILEPVSKGLVSGYNGIVTLTMLDCDEKVTAIDDYDETAVTFLKFGGALNRSSYKVENGRFTAGFILPKDISFSENKGRLFAYSYSDDSQYAKGSFNNYIIDGILDVSDPDRKGPEISVYLDSRKFEPGDIVAATPLLIVDLSDESGINSTGIGIGHKIEAWIDNSPNSINLTDKFSTSMNNSRAGYIEQLLFGLAPGRHDIKVRGWDVFNNFSIAETYFYIKEPSGGGEVYDLTNYPNPFGESTTISFKHNVQTPCKARIEIFGILGNSIYSDEVDIASPMSVDIPWNGRDSQGNSLPQGAYLCYVSVWNSKMAGSQKSGLMIYLP